MDGPPSDEDIETQLRRYAIWYSNNKLVDVVGTAIEDAHQDVVKQRYGLGTPTDDADCISLLTGALDECTHDHQHSNPKDVEPPHEPVDAASTDLWLSRNQPAAYSLHFEDLDAESVARLLAFSRGHDLDLVFDPTSFRDALQTTHIILLPESRQ